MKRYQVDLRLGIMKRVMRRILKRVIYLFIIATLLIFYYRHPGRKVNQPYDYSVQVVSITDGDTFRGITDDSVEVRFRIHGIDAPERKQPFSQKSKEHLSSLIYNKMVGIVEQTEQDRYGRPVVWVYTPDGNDVSAEMIKAGMAAHYKHYSNDKNYANLEKEARMRRIGIWSDPNPVMPWELRREQREGAIQPN